MTLIAALVLLPVMKEGQFWDYTLTSRFTNADTDLANEESLRIRVDKVEPKAIQLTFVQKLIATSVDGQRIVTDYKAAPSERKWTLFSNGSVAFSPPERGPVEGIFQRVLRSIRDRDSDRGDWISEFMDETESMTAGAVAVVRSVHNKIRVDQITYRAQSQPKIVGTAIWNAKLPFPELLKLRIPKTRMQGGTEDVACDLELKFVPPPEKKLQTANR
ncbi:MAG: hypothetical protein WCK51_06565 [Armatimonadota bacterium]